MPKDAENMADVEVGVTWDTYVELGKPAGIPVIPAGAGETRAYVCPTYVPGTPFLMPGNVVGRCAICDHHIQMRPHAPAAARKICTPCGLMQGMQLPPFFPPPVKAR